jgi:AcrR family transcriptional regulator
MTTQHNRRIQAREKRRLVEQQLMRAVVDLLAQQPLHEITIDDAMRSTGLSRTAFYRYFPDLETILLRLVEEVPELFMMPAGDGPGFLSAPTDSDYRELSVRAVRHLATVFGDRAPVLRAVVNVDTVAPDAHHAWVEIQDDFINRIAARIQDLKDIGRSTVTNPSLTARALILMMVNALLEIDLNTPEIVEAHVFALAEIMYRAIFATDDESPADTPRP